MIVPTQDQWNAMWSDPDLWRQHWATVRERCGDLDHYHRFLFQCRNVRREGSARGRVYMYRVLRALASQARPTVAHTSFVLVNPNTGKVSLVMTPEDIRVMGAYLTSLEQRTGCVAFECWPQSDDKQYSQSSTANKPKSMQSSFLGRISPSLDEL